MFFFWMLNDKRESVEEYWGLKRGGGLLRGFVFFYISYVRVIRVDLWEFRKKEVLEI